jgi:pimeloyl-ACP methyl ester carboxylesterase
MAGYADCLRGFVERIGIDRPHVAGLSFGGALAIEYSRRHPTALRSLVLVSAYAGWAGSLSAEAAAQRLDQAMTLAELPPDELVATLLPSMFTERTPRALVDQFGAAVRAFHPAGFRAMARASAENLRDALAQIDVPTLLVYGDQDVRAPIPVAEDLHAAIAGSSLVVLPGAGHVCNIDAGDEFNAAVRRFLRSPG